MTRESEDYLRQQLYSLTEEHFAINQLIDSTGYEDINLDQVMLQRLKKRKLLLKDKIQEIRSMLYPDIIA